MREVARLKALLSAFARKPSLLSEAASERGVSVSAFSSPVQKFLNDQPVRAARLRLEHRRYTPTEKPEQAERRLIRLSLLSAEGKPVSSYDLPLSPWSPLNRQPPRLVTSGVKRQSR
jgi:hypothetical protein